MRVHRRRCWRVAQEGQAEQLGLCGVLPAEVERPRRLLLCAFTLRRWRRRSHARVILRHASLRGLGSRRQALRRGGDLLSVGCELDAEHHGDWGRTRPGARLHVSTHQVGGHSRLAARLPVQHHVAEGDGGDVPPPWSPQPITAAAAVRRRPSLRTWGRHMRRRRQRLRLSALLRRLRGIASARMGSGVHAVWGCRCWRRRRRRVLQAGAAAQAVAQVCGPPGGELLLCAAGLVQGTKVAGQLEKQGCCRKRMRRVLRVGARAVLCVWQGWRGCVSDCGRCLVSTQLLAARRAVTVVFASGVLEAHPALRTRESARSKTELAKARTWAPSASLPWRPAFGRSVSSSVISAWSAFLVRGSDGEEALPRRRASCMACSRR